MKVIINNNTINVKISSTPNSIMKGMMKKRFDDTFNGMLFLLPSTEDHSFWMFNCIIPLDIIFIDGNEITEIHHDCPPCKIKNECESYIGYGNKVLEVIGGYCKENGIKKGDRISFSIF